MSMSPYNFFGKTERITLQRTKDYEDLLKAGLSRLAAEFPKETRELLFCAQMHDPPKEFDLCEMILDLKSRDMLPALPFHLNSFEAIKLYQQLLAGIEYRQKRDHPTYYLNLALEKDARKKETEAQKKSTGESSVCWGVLYLFILYSRCHQWCFKVALYHAVFVLYLPISNIFVCVPTDTPFIFFLT